MALLKWLRKRRGKHAAQKEAAQEKTLPFENAPEVVLTPNEQVVNDFLHIINSQGELAQFVDPDANIRFKETPMTFAGFQEEMGRIFESLPDFKLNIVGPIKEQSDGTVLANMFATGTHTGKPYSFGPFPEIDSKGAAITLDPEYVPSYAPTLLSKTQPPYSLEHTEIASTRSETEK